MRELEGRTIETVREMTDDEVEQEFGMNGFGENPTMMILDDGTKVFPSSDFEGNGGGVMFGRDEGGGFRF